MALKQRRKKAVPYIPVVSMADIAFLLIIFFMLCTTFVRESGLQLQLPGAQATDTLPPQKEVRISIDRSKQIRVDDQRVLLEDLDDVLYEKLAPRSSKAVLIRADESIDWGTVVQVLDVPKTLEERKGWEIGINVAVEDLDPPEEETSALPGNPEPPTAKTNPGK